MTEQPPDPGTHERRIAGGAIAQQASQVVGVLAMLVVITVLGRTLTLSEFGVYGLLISIASYVLIVQISVEGAAVRAIARAGTSGDRDGVFSSALVLYALAGVLCGLLVAAGGAALVGVLGIPAGLRDEAREGVAALGVAIMFGWPFKVFQDALRGAQRFGAASVAEVLAQVAFVAGMLTLVALDAPLWAVIALGGSLPTLIGIASAIVLVTTRAGFRFRRALVSRATMRELARFSAGLSVIGVTDLIVYSLDRVVLAAFRNAATIGLYEAASRPHNLVRQLHGTLVLTVIPVASGYIAEGDEFRLRELIVRGTRYVMAVVVPVTVVLMMLAGPILRVWLGDEFLPAEPAMVLFLSYWLISSGTGVGTAMLVAAGRVGELARYAWAGALLNLALAVVLTPWLGLTGPVLATAIQSVALFPWFLVLVRRHLPVRTAELAREAWLPAYAIGGAIALVLGAARLTLGLDSLAAVGAAATLALAAGWAAYYALYLNAGERNLIRSFLRRR
jgi:O-antigen/teichoic acid export membrane protein